MSLKPRDPREDYQARIKEVLEERFEVSKSLETELISKAEALLAQRRQRAIGRERSALQTRHVSRKFWSTLHQGLNHGIEFFTIHPNTPAAAAVLAVLVVSLAVLNDTRAPSVSLRYSDLPEVPKLNDASARYDAQNLAEAQAYEREVEDAHQKASGGI